MAEASETWGAGWGQGAGRGTSAFCTGTGGSSVLAGPRQGDGHTLRGAGLEPRPEQAFSRDGA